MFGSFTKVGCPPNQTSMDDFKTNETLDIKSCPIEFPNLLCEEKSIEPQTFSHVKQTKRSDVSESCHFISKVFGATTT